MPEDTVPSVIHRLALDHTSALVELMTTFEGAPLQTLTWNNKPCWVARHLGERLGYKQDGKEFSKQVLGRWSDELAEGTDYAFLTGAELKAFNAMSAEGGQEPPSQNAGRGLLVLFESGMHLALMKTRKPLGVKLRRFLADEVLPQLLRTGRYEPEAQITPVPQQSQQPALDVELERERLSVRRLELETKGKALDLQLCAMRVYERREAQGKPCRSDLARLALGGVVLVASDGAPTPLAPPAVRVELPDHTIEIPDFVPPDGFSIVTIKALGGRLDCAWTEARSRIKKAGLWLDERYHRLLQHPIVRRGKKYIEDVHVFSDDICAELRRRESPMFGGDGAP